MPEKMCARGARELGEQETWRAGADEGEQATMYATACSEQWEQVTRSATVCSFPQGWIRQLEAL